MATLVLRGFGQVFVAAAGLPRHRLYDLRHTSATHLLADGAPITYVAAPLGHRKPTTTPAFYAHWIPRGDKTYIDRLAAARLTDMSDAKLLETSGAGGGSRTRDLLITNGFGAFFAGHAPSAPVTLGRCYLPVTARRWPRDAADRRCRPSTHADHRIAPGVAPGVASGGL